MATYGDIVNGIRYGYAYIRITGEAGNMSGEADWHSLVKGMLKGEIKRRNMTYEHVSAKLADIGVHETPTNLRTKISRGGFSAVFFVQCLKAIGCDAVRLT